MDNAQKCDYYINLPFSHTYGSYLQWILIILGGYNSYHFRSRLFWKQKQNKSFLLRIQLRRRLGFTLHSSTFPGTRSLSVRKSSLLAFILIQANSAVSILFHIILHVIFPSLPIIFNFHVWIFTSAPSSQKLLFYFSSNVRFIIISIRCHFKIRIVILFITLYAKKE
jgi:hypothetical protein